MPNFLKFLFLLLLILGSFSVYPQYLHRSGQKIVDKNGNEVILRGMGLGGWMLQEPYMMEMSGIAIAQWQIRSKIKSLIGEQNTVAFYDAWHANHCTKADIDSMASWGFNSVRLPMHYNLYTLPIEEEPVPGAQTWLEKGFALTDSLIKWCGANQMYVILDLHAAPGGQGMDYAICDGNPALPSLWEDEANKQKTIALWKKLATRYATEPWVGGYDLINEPNWSFTSGGNQNGCSENSNAPLKQLLIQITNAIREVDNNHIIIIEGNCWGNNYNGVLPPWDNNMVLSFHKYWSNNDQGSIQGIMNLRSQHSIPIWLGESGENSNAWFTDAISLVEKNRIGWAWWPLKKINSVVNPLTIQKTAEYQTLLNYWKNGGTAPSSGYATFALMQMATNARIEYCIYRKDVTDAMFRQVVDTTTRNYLPLQAPGIVHCSDFDLGRYGIAYSDKYIANYQVSTGEYTAWNQGWVYRNDGVDIESNIDSHSGSNGFSIGWTEDDEWMQYTVEVDSTAVYQIVVRHTGTTISKINMMTNGAYITGSVVVPATGGYQAWTNLVINDIVLYKGENRLRLFIEKGGANLGFMQFIPVKETTDVSFKAVSAETDQIEGFIYLSLNKKIVDSTLSSQGFHCTVNGTEVLIQALEVSQQNGSVLRMSVDKELFFDDIVKLSYAGSLVTATDGTKLAAFQDLVVRNNLPTFLAIPGKIEAEAFSFNQGLQLETTTDVGGGQSVGFTNTGDYLDYRVKVVKSSQYLLEVRIACLNNAGSLQFQQLDLNDQVINSSTVNVPVTGGWQTWKTVTGKMTLAEGLCKLRVKIMDPEFNINWYRFSDKGIGLQMIPSHNLRVFPNPAAEELTVEMPSGTHSVHFLSFLSLNGKVVKRMDLDAGMDFQTIYIGDLPKGFYLMEMESNGLVSRQKLLIQ